MASQVTSLRRSQFPTPISQYLSQVQEGSVGPSEQSYWRVAIDLDGEPDGTPSGEPDARPGEPGRASGGPASEAPPSPEAHVWRLNQTVKALAACKGFHQRLACRFGLSFALLLDCPARPSNRP
jgi:hypothetical protein